MSACICIISAPHGPPQDMKMTTFLPDYINILLKWKLARRQKRRGRSFLRRITNPPFFFCYMVYVHVMKKPAHGRPLLISSSSLSNNGMHLKICQELYFSLRSGCHSTGRSRMYGMMHEVAEKRVARDERIAQGWCDDGY